MEASQESQTKRRSFISRLRSSKSVKTVKEPELSLKQPEKEINENDVAVEVIPPVSPPEEEDRQPSPSTGSQPKPGIVTREGVPIISGADGATHSFKPSDVRQNRRFLRKGKRFEKKSITLEKAPAACDSAFSGPPRYDWIDIVSVFMDVAWSHCLVWEKVGVLYGFFKPYS